MSFKFHDKFLDPMKRLHTLLCSGCGKGTTFDIGADGNVLRCPHCGKELARKQEATK